MDLESGKVRTTKLRRKGQSLSAATAALKEIKEEESDDEDDMDTDGAGPMWQLFDQLYNTANASGRLTVHFLLYKLRLQLFFYVC